MGARACRYRLSRWEGPASPPGPDTEPEAHRGSEAAGEGMCRAVVAEAKGGPAQWPGPLL